MFRLWLGNTEQAALPLCSQLPLCQSRVTLMVVTSLAGMLYGRNEAMYVKGFMNCPALRQGARAVQPGSHILVRSQTSGGEGQRRKQQTLVQGESQDPEAVRRQPKYLFSPSHFMISSSGTSHDLSLT